MTCPHCGRTVRAELLLLALHHGLDPHQFTRLYEDTKGHPMNTHITLTPRAGDIGEEETEWEVLPTHQPVEIPEPAPSEPVPA